MSIDSPSRADEAVAPTPAPDPASGTTGLGLALTHRQILIVFSGLMIGMFLAALDQTIVGTALPTIVNSLHGLNHISWVVTAYLLTSTISTPLYGKLSDQFGRKGLYQIAIVIFLVGSALSGLSQNMAQLIAFRGIQGLGAGGLMALAFTIIADVVSPRERGRYQAYFGATFALSSIAGPLLGGVFTDNLSWRWIFYINMPIGIVALAVTSAVLKLPFRRQAHKIDFLGSGLMLVGVTAALLVTVWGGTQYAWGSPVILGLAVAAVVLITAFVLWERKAAEPILPPNLYHIGIFRVSTSVSFVLAMIMFGAIIYLPLYLQLVDGVSAMVSGLLMIPMMMGVLGASILSGQVVSRTGRYKVFPVVGSVLVTVGMVLLSHLGLHTSHLTMSLYVIVLGTGMGMTMQVMVLAVQNAVPGRPDGSGHRGGDLLPLPRRRLRHLTVRGGLHRRPEPLDRPTGAGGGGLGHPCERQLLDEPGRAPRLPARGAARHPRVLRPVPPLDVPGRRAAGRRDVRPDAVLEGGPAAVDLGARATDRGRGHGRRHGGGGRRRVRRGRDR